MPPRSKPHRHILVAVSGNTPQIVTETLYCWRITHDPPVPISEIYIVTTTKGKEVAWKKLGGSTGAVSQFCNAYGISSSSIDFTEDHIIVVTDHAGNPLDDIRTREDNRALRASLLGFIKALTADTTTVLYCAMGGGRRTMSAYMMLAMTLYGRENDRLTHVLVNEEFETNRDFFFPVRGDDLVAVKTSDGSPVLREARRSNLQLARVPFIRLRSRLPDEEREDIEDDIKLVQENVEAPEPLVLPKLRIHINRGEVSFGGHPINLPPLPLTLLIYYAEMRLTQCKCKEIQICDFCEECFLEPPQINLDRFLEIYKRVTNKSAGQYNKMAESYRKAKFMSAESVRPIHTAMERALKKLVHPLKISRTRTGGGLTRYGLALERNRIDFVG